MKFTIPENIKSNLLNSQTNKLTFFINDNNLMSYVLFKDFNQKPIFTISSSQSSEILKLGKKAITTSSNITIIIMIISFMILAFILELNFFRRIKKIQSAVKKIHNTRDDLQTRLTDNGNDEISSLVQSINNMLAAIQYANDQRDEMQKNLFQSSKLASIAELAGGIAHEINNPLAILQMSLDDLKSVCAQRCNYLKTKDFFDIHTKTISRIALIAKYLLDYTKTNDDGNEICNTHELIYKTIELLNPLYQKENIKIITDLNALNSNIKISNKNFQTILLNLFTNSKESFQNDQLNKIISIEDRIYSENRYIIVIKDNGRGIPSDNLPRIFDNFYTTYPTKKSLGLGLPLTQNLVLNSSGSIQVDSKQNQGTIVTITFPLAHIEE